MYGRLPNRRFFDRPYLFLIEPPGDYSEPPGKNPSIATASPRGSIRKKPVTNFYPPWLNPENRLKKEPTSWLSIQR
jgi:hypothetical protein